MLTLHITKEPIPNPIVTSRRTLLDHAVDRHGQLCEGVDNVDHSFQLFCRLRHDGVTTRGAGVRWAQLCGYVRCDGLSDLLPHQFIDRRVLQRRAILN